MFPLDLTDTTMTILIVACAMPAIWIVYWLVMGLFSGKGVQMNIGSAPCAIGLIWIAALILLATRQIV